MAHALPNAASFLILLFILLTSTTTLALSQSSSSSTSGTDLFNWLQSRSTCQDTISNCIDPEEDEFDLDSESNRRILATSSYISYGALNRNRVPCSRRGASYYNCQAGAQANPYSRGCSAITRCRS